MFLYLYIVYLTELSFKFYVPFMVDAALLSFGQSYSFTFRHKLSPSNLLFGFTMFLQELKRREDAIQRGLPSFYTCSKSTSEANVPCILQKKINNLFCFGSWNYYRGEKLATLFSTYPSWYCNWNTYSSTEDPVCCIHNIFRYVKILFVIVVRVSGLRFYIIITLVVFTC